MTSTKRLGPWCRHRQLMFVATSFGALMLGRQLYQLPVPGPVVLETEWNTTLWVPPSVKSKSATNQMAMNHWDYNTSKIDFAMAPGSHQGTTTNPRSSTPFRNLTLPLCLVHIGKSAGSSVSCGLGFTYANCEGMPRDRIPNTHFFHMRRKNCPVDNTATLLVTLRNPIDRIQSWFEFEKKIVPTRRGKKEEEHMRWKRGLLFAECFSEFVALASVGLTPFLGNQSVVDVVKVQNMTCQERAWAAIMGVREFSYHEWFNYEHYWEGVQLLQTSSSSSSSRRPALKVLRTEHLHEDWGSVSTEALYRHVNQRRPSPVERSEQNNGTTTHHHQVSSGENTRKDKNSGLSSLPSIAIENLCRALCPEIQFYKRFLMAADNLNATQRLQSIQEIQRSCPQETPELRESCPDIPSFPPLQVPKRQHQTETKKRLFLPIIPINRKNKKKTANNKSPD